MAHFCSVYMYTYTKEITALLDNIFTALLDNIYQKYSLMLEQKFLLIIKL